MKQNLIIGIVIALVVVAIFFLGRDDTDTLSEADRTPTGDVFQEQTTPDDGTPSNTDNQSTGGQFDALVTYTDEGYSPKTITISEGDTVRFLNNADGRMWTASAIHPTHTLYPEKTANDCLGSAFDQCEAAENGTFWEFTFTETGEWNYHNHVRANHTGTVIVESN